MADIKVKIKLQETTEDTISSIGSSANINNASIAKSSGTNTFSSQSTKSEGMLLKSWASGELSLSDGYVGGANTMLIEQHGYNGYMFTVPSTGGALSVTFTITGSNIDSVVIYGDKSANQFPTEAYRDGNSSDIITSDDTEWAIRFASASSSHSITFTKWNRDDYPACITYIGVMTNELVLDKAWLKSVESLAQSTGQPREVSYGITPSSGSIEVIDRNGEILDYINDGILPVGNLPVTIKVNGKIVQEHITQDSEYDPINRELSILLTNTLKQWGSSNSNEVVFSSQSRTAYDMMVSALGITDAMLGDGVKSYLQSITIPYAEMPKDKKSVVAKKFCDLAQLNIYQDDDGNIHIASGRPLKQNGEKTIFIPKSKTLESPKFNAFRKKVSSVGVPTISVGSKDGKFGNVTTINMEQELDELVTEESFNRSQYSLIYNTDQNIFNGNTTTYSEAHDYYFPNGGGTVDFPTYDHLAYTVTFYKTHLELDLSPYKLSGYPYSDIGFYISASIKGKNRNSSGQEYSPYKTYAKDVTLAISEHNNDTPSEITTEAQALAQLEDFIRIDNLYISANNSLVFDFYTIKDLTIADTSTSGVLSHKFIEKAISVNIQLYGTHYETSEVKPSGEKDIMFSQNELIRTGTTINGSSASTVIANNITSDYSNGIRTATASIVCLDYNYTDNTQAKDWSQGQVVQVGELVQFESDSTTWRVTGRRFIYDGVPTVELELQEVVG